jgi:hypothetical protein
MHKPNKYWLVAMLSRTTSTLRVGVHSVAAAQAVRHNLARETRHIHLAPASSVGHVCLVDHRITTRSLSSNITHESKFDLEPEELENLSEEMQRIISLENASQSERNKVRFWEYSSPVIPQCPEYKSQD